MIPTYSRALIVGAGSGLSASLARVLAADGMAVGLAARNVDKLAALAAETGAAVHACDASQPAEVEALFARL
ncbi:MAG: SDR family NAD(P)-dependent oxidoreductase, partial [Actinomycetospora chiangmaiensis]|nr:SDR family NAD(P)-dependent oxidoreductase [Actinomycetospora chiangmaiensis]